MVLATVYNNLNRLWQEKLIRKVSVEGMPDRYDRIQRMIIWSAKDVANCWTSIWAILPRILKKAGAFILSYDLKLNYLCDECQRK